MRTSNLRGLGKLRSRAPSTAMDAFAALMTEGFHDSDWTDQEVGFALARGVPVIAVKLGRDPYGFLGKFQALRADWDQRRVGHCEAPRRARPHVQRVHPGPA